MKQLPWTLLALTLGLVVWLSVAVIHAENQRNALLTRACADPVFKGEVDAKCLANIQSRQNWWQHLTYALTHVKP